MKSVLILLASLLFAADLRAQPDSNPHGLPDGLYTEITIERGVVVCELFFHKTPMTVANYVGLAEGTLGPQPRKPFYEGLKWHRVVADFVVQGGDGGPIGYEFPDECVPGLRHDSMGVLQMANDGPDSNGSQYCLMLSPQQRLNYNHTVFGHVVRGLDVLPQIRQGDTMHVKILRLGTEAKAFRADETAFAELVAKAKRYSGPRTPGPDAPFDDPDGILPTDIPRARHFNFKLVNFQRFTGRKLAARVYAHAPDSAAGHLDDYFRGEAARLGVVPSGALAVYLADRDQWHIYVGDNSISAFVTDAPTTDSPAQQAALARALDDFLTDAKKRSVEFVAKAEKAASPGKPLTNGQKIKYQVDAVLDGLIFKLEPR
jgi:cyclophilin family peptidyl-prolyl cis-trans isomerase